MTDQTEEEGPTHEGTAGVTRVEAFSDGVIAIIVTIMVLELRAPEAEDIRALWQLWPIFIAYVLSYAYVAIYWVNHHRLFGHVRGLPLAQCLRLGAVCAAEIISHFGARAEADLQALVKQRLA
jgi:hypothetical protein